MSNKKPIFSLVWISTKFDDTHAQKKTKKKNDRYEQFDNALIFSQEPHNDRTIVLKGDEILSCYVKALFK